MKTAICAIIKDEHLFLKEWIDWHLGLGFDAIHLFEDKGSKSHEEITKEYDNVFLRRYEDDEEVQKVLTGKLSSRQTDLYNKFILSKTGQKYKWIACIDIDEYITLTDGLNLGVFLSEYTDFPAVHLSWKMKGASGHIVRPEGSIQKAYTNDGNFLSTDTKWRVKSIVNVSKFTVMTSPHHTKGGVDTNKVENKDTILYDKAWINHYFTKSWEDWLDRIYSRGDVNIGHRTLVNFFECNPDMEHLRMKLINSVSHRIPNGTYWIDKKNGIIAGGNVKQIMALNNRITSRLIFDLGFHDGDTAEYYLKQGHTVIGVECNPSLIKQSTEKFCDFVCNKKLRLVNKCIFSEDNKKEIFYISTHPVWSSLNKNIAERKEKSTPIEVSTITLAKLIDEYGCPDYCKIDIEGNDVIAVHSLMGLDTKPKIISVEAECLGVGEQSTINMIDELYNVGYRLFFIVDQRLFESFRFDFHQRYNWLDYDDACKQLEELKKQEFEYGVWADIYATY